MSEIKLEDVDDLGEVTRLVVMIELEPLSDRYVQVQLTSEAFNKVSAAAWEDQPDSVAHPGRKMIKVRPMEPVKIPDLQTTYDLECCEFCKPTTIEDIETGDRVPLKTPVCINPDCIVCHRRPSGTM